MEAAVKLRGWYTTQGAESTFTPVLSGSSGASSSSFGAGGGDSKAGMIQKIVPSTLQILSDINDVEIHRAGMNAQHYYTVLATITAVKRSSMGSTAVGGEQGMQQMQLDVFGSSTGKQHSQLSYLACSECLKKVTDTTAKECP
uniref:Uncharacterized protein n=1 Tax=Lygus hesperus TaxID=30085 RepID=A0A0A9X0M1_LYGHE